MQHQILTLTIPILAIVFACVFGTLWWRDRARKHILAYAYWFAAVALGLVLQTFIFTSFGPVEVVIFHGLSSSALIALAWGVAKRDGMRAPIMAATLVTAATGVILWFARTFGEQSILLMVQNFNGGLLFAMAAFAKWQAPARHAADRMLLFTLSALAAYAFIRPSVTVLIQSQMTMEEYQSSIFLTVNLAVTAFSAIVLALALIATIVTDKMEQQRGEATIDLLSGLKMRRAFEQSADEMIERAARLKKPVSLIMSDIDHFKRINDGWGHATGDMVITKFGELIADQIRATDIAGRVGGEEFCILVWNCEMKAAATLAERLRKATSVLGGDGDCGSMAVTASFGVAQRQRGETYADMYGHADASLYDAKAAGRDCVFANGKRLRKRERSNPEDDLVPILG